MTKSKTFAEQYYRAPRKAEIEVMSVLLSENHNYLSKPIIADFAKVSKNTVTHHLNKLTDLGCIDSVPNMSRLGRLYLLNDKGVELAKDRINLFEADQAYKQEQTGSQKAKDANREARIDYAHSVIKRLNLHETFDLLERLWGKQLLDNVAEIVRRKGDRVTFNHLKQLARSQEAKMREIAAKNSNLDVGELVKLTQDTDVSVRVSAAQNPNLSVEQLILLTGDDSVTVRSMVARHPNLPEKQAIELANDDNEFIRQSAISNPNYPEKLLDKILKTQQGPNILVAIAMRPNLNAEHASQLAKSEYPRVRINASQQLSLPEETLLELAEDKDLTVILAVAKNPRLPYEKVVELARNPDEKIREAAISNPSLTPSEKEKLRQQGKKLRLVRELQSSYS